ncbi:MAG: hypothetical protein KDD91_06800, partial [Caldilinea sp.]|nr:hypothetical protein [Caldilinea sp.]
MRTFARWKRPLWRALAGSLVLAVVAAAGIYGWLFADLPSVSDAQLRATHPTTQILDRNGKLLYELIDVDAGKQIDL